MAGTEKDNDFCFGKKKISNIQENISPHPNKKKIVASVMMVVMGFIVYYVIPYAFTFNNLQLFFLVLIMILLGTKIFFFFCEFFSFRFRILVVNIFILLLYFFF